MKLLEEIKLFLWIFILSFAGLLVVDLRLDKEELLTSVVIIGTLLVVYFTPAQCNKKLYYKVLTFFWSFYAAWLFEMNITSTLVWNCEVAQLYLSLLVLASILILLMILPKNSLKTKNEKRELFKERKKDLERLENMLQYCSVIGIDGQWGSGKSFLVDQLNPDKYIFVKIDILSCNLSEIQSTLIGELDKVLKQKKIFSGYSPSLQYMLSKNSYIERFSWLFMKNNIPYAKAVEGFSKDLEKVNKTVLIIFEDLDRIDKVDEIKKVLNISEKLARNNVKVIYQYDENNLNNKELDRRYLEKYIPNTILLSPIGFDRIISYVIKENDYSLETDQFKFITRDIWLKSALLQGCWIKSLMEEIPNPSIRKVQIYLHEISTYLNNNNYPDDYRHVIIAYFFIKEFFYEEFKKFEPGKDAIDSFLFKLQDSDGNKFEETFKQLTYDIGKNTEDKAGKDQMRQVVLSQENRTSAWILGIFGFQLDVEDRSVLNDSAANLNNKNENEKINRIIWNLLCGSYGILTDYEAFVKEFTKYVLQEENSKLQRKKYRRLSEKYRDGQDFNGEDRENETIFKMGAAEMVTAFQALKVIGINNELWKKAIDFYIDNLKMDNKPIDLIQSLIFCEISDRDVFLYVLKKYNSLNIDGNMNDVKEFWEFLRTYLNALIWLGFIDRNQAWILSELNRRVDTKDHVLEYVFRPLKETINGEIAFVEKNLNAFDKGKKDLIVIKDFLEKNEQIMCADKKLKREPAINVEFKGPKTVDKLYEELQLGEMVEDEFEETILNMYNEKKLSIVNMRQLYDIRDQKKK